MPFNTYFERAGFKACGNVCSSILKIFFKASLSKGSRINKSFRPNPCVTLCEAGIRRDFALKKSIFSTFTFSGFNINR